MNVILLELILVATVALGIGFWQLYDVNKELKKDRLNDQHKRLNNKKTEADGNSDSEEDTSK